MAYRSLSSHTPYKSVTLLTPCSRVLLEKPTSFQLVKEFPHFMEHEGSLPQSQVPSNCPYPAPVRSSPHPHIPLSKIHLNIILPSMTVSPKWSLSLKFPHQNPVYAYPLPISATCAYGGDHPKKKTNKSNSIDRMSCSMAFIRWEEKLHNITKD